MNSKPAKIKAVSTDDDQLTLWLDDGRIVSAPLSWYPSLAEATPAERKIWQSSGAGHGIHWPALNYEPMGIGSPPNPRAPRSVTPRY